LDPALPPGEALASYRLSPDGRHLAFTTRKVSTPPRPERKVAIASYRERFMKVSEVLRQVSEDAAAPAEVKVYLHELTEPMVENGTLTPVFSHTLARPRDLLTRLEWSADSRKVAFA